MSQPSENDLEIGHIHIVKNIDAESGQYYIGVHYSDDLPLADAVQMIAWANQFVVEDYSQEDGP